MGNSVIKANGGVDILIVEDSLTQAEQLKYLLENHFYSVITAKNGRHALELKGQ